MDTSSAERIQLLQRQRSAENANGVGSTGRRQHRKQSLLIGAAGILRASHDRGSLLHRFLDYEVWTKRPFPRTRIYVASIVVTYVPLLVAAALSPLSLWTPSPALHLPFLRDWNISFAFLVSFPTLVVLLATDDHEFRVSLELIRSQGVICVNSSDLV
jgi:hypothetical protein